MARATLVLYSTLGCHLCEQAELLLLALPLTEPLVVEVVDISDDDALVQRFGTRIPVLGWEETGDRTVNSIGHSIQLRYWLFWGKAL